ncbi:MAG: 4-hydroxy-tetrahydrodipicolinate synthase [Actinomycetota bacterium]
MAGRFGAVITAMATPFAEDGSLDLDGVQALTAHLFEHGSDTVFVTGSTGESPTLTDAEKRDVFRAAVEAAKGKGQVLAGTGTYSTAESIELTREAEKAGVDGVVVVTPYYNKPPQRGLVAHFSKIAESTSLPVVAYNIPGRTATRIEHDTLLTLAAVPNIVAVKDSTGDFDAVSRLIREAPAGFDVYSGDDWATFGTACLGAVGIVSVASHLVGDRIAQMLHLVFDGDVPSARKIHEELSPLFSVLFIASNPIPLKAALGIVGLPGGDPRLPLLPATPDERERIRRVLEDTGLL